MFIDGIGISGYRSFGGKLQHIGPFGLINVFVGRNNSGKSNILRYLLRHYNEIQSVVHSENDLSFFKWNDFHFGMTFRDMKFSFGINLDNVESLIDNIISRYTFMKKTWVKDILRCLTINSSRIAWFDFEYNNGLHLSHTIINRIQGRSEIADWEWREMFKNFTNIVDQYPVEHAVALAIKNISIQRKQKIKVDIIPAFRKIGQGDKVEGDHSGLGIIDELAKFQNPESDKPEERLKFEKINGFVRSVVAIDELSLEVPHTRKYLQVHIGGNVLPLESMGTGLHEAVILAAVCTILENQIVCIEEPEIHLHPTLQRKLIRYLREHTTNQYFITTHSAHLMDEDGINIFRLRLIDGATYVNTVKYGLDRFQVCKDLGYRASDIVQSNCIIWAEGPSDREYIRYWIEKKDDSLVEGLHFSIMFYGGRLLANLKAGDAEIDEFISLSRLNQNIAIIIDSDKDSVNKKINATKGRVSKEVKERNGYVWITKGREIENYLTDDKIENYLKTVAKAAKHIPGNQTYGKRYMYINSKGNEVEADKVKLARFVSSMEPDWGVLDLEKKVIELVEFIREANGMDAGNA